MFPERFSNLPAYAFPRLRALLDVHEPGGPVQHMTIGEPKHAFPEWLADVIAQASSEFGKYPPNDGTPELRVAISAWMQGRYGVNVDPATQIMPLNGTREGLYNAGMALCPETKSGQRPAVLMPNPFYQVYMISSISVGAEPIFVDATSDTGHLPDFTEVDPEILARTALCYICSPANPQGAVADETYWTRLITLAERYDFRILADECYSEIYRDTPPPGALQVAQKMGADPERVLVFHSLSKRSNVPGLRSGFVTGGPECLQRIKQLRAYSGAPLPLPIQRASERLWSDDAHVAENRALYQEKYDLADRIFGDIPGYLPPQAGFFLWLPVEDGEAAALQLWKNTGIRVLPGAYLSQEGPNGNPGKSYIRVAMVHDLKQTEKGLTGIREELYRQ